MRLHKPRLINLVSYLLFAVSAAILVTVAAFTVNVQVLKDWRLILPCAAGSVTTPQQTCETAPIHVSDTIVIQSNYTKLRAVTGEAHRYIDCANTSGAYIRYAINQATADRAPSAQTGTGVIIQIPNSIPQLPTTCKISINVTYKVYPWRSVTEFQSTGAFTLLPSVTPAVVSSVTTRTSPGQAASQGQASNTSSFSYAAPAAAPPQQETSQAPVPVQPQPSLIQQFLSLPVSLTQGLLNVIK